MINNTAFNQPAIERLTWSINTFNKVKQTKDATSLCVPSSRPIRFQKVSKICQIEAKIPLFSNLISNSTRWKQKLPNKALNSLNYLFSCFPPVLANFSSILNTAFYAHYVAICFSANHRSHILPGFIYCISPECKYPTSRNGIYTKHGIHYRHSQLAKKGMQHQMINWYYVSFKH